MKRVIRPFWSYDIVETEKWLELMSAKGFHLTKFNRFTRSFHFQNGEKKHTTFQIGYDSLRSSQIPKALKEDGWDKHSTNGKWSIMVNHKPKEEIKTATAREQLIKRNRVHSYLYSAFLIYCAFMILINFHNLSLLFFLSNDVEIMIVDSPYWAITYLGIGITVLLLFLSIFSIFKIKRGNRSLVLSNFSHPGFEVAYSDVLPLEIEEEMQLRKSGKLIKKLKPYWIYQPDKLENWLEEMEAKGYHLYHVSRLGNSFYLMKGQPRLVSYCAIYENIPNETAFFLHKENGWEPVYSSRQSLQKWTIWAKEYQEGEEKPYIYNEKETHLRAARKIAATNSIMFWPIMILYAWIIISELVWSLSSSRTLGESNYFLLIMFTILFILFGTFTYQSWSYFFRIKRRYKH